MTVNQLDLSSRVSKLDKYEQELDVSIPISSKPELLTISLLRQNKKKTKPRKIEHRLPMPKKIVQMVNEVRDQCHTVKPTLSNKLILDLDLDFEESMLVKEEIDDTDKFMCKSQLGKEQFVSSLRQQNMLTPWSQHVTIKTTPKQAKTTRKILTRPDLDLQGSATKTHNLQEIDISHSRNVDSRPLRRNLVTNSGN